MIKKQKSRRKAKYVLNHLREADRQEMLEAYGDKWFSRVFRSLMKIDFVIGVSRRTNKPFVIFGDKADENNNGVVFLLSTDEIENKKFQLIKASRKEIERISNKYDMIYNLIHDRNYKMHHLLKALGFRVMKYIQVKKNFKFFYKRKFLKGVGE